MPTSVFTEAELAYLAEQRLGRLATVGKDGRPHVSPVGFRHDADTDTIVIGGHNFGASKKFRDARDQPHVAFVVDDLKTVDPWRPRGIEIRGTAQTFVEPGGDARGFDENWIRIAPTRIIAWGIDTQAFGAPNARDVTAAGP